MTNGGCIYRKTVDYMSRMALEKDDFLKVFSDLGISCYRKLGRGARCIKVGVGRIKPNYVSLSVLAAVLYGVSYRFLAFSVD